MMTLSNVLTTDSCQYTKARDDYEVEGELGTTVICSDCHLEEVTTRKPDDAEQPGVEQAALPDEKRVYIAFKGSVSLKNIAEQNPSDQSIALAIKKRKKSQIAARKLVNKYGIAPLVTSLRALFDQKVFTSIDAAKRRFPDLFPEEPLDADTPEEAATEEDPWIQESKTGHDLPDEPGVAAKDDEPTNDPEPEVTEGYHVDIRDAEKPCDENFLQSHHIDDGDDDSVSDEPLEDPAKSTNLEQEPSLMEVDPAEETKPAEVKESCRDHVGEDQNTISLPFSSQHKLMVHLQEVLEGACFAYGRRNLAGILRERGWDCVEAVPLTTWVNTLMHLKHTFGTQPSKGLLQSIAEIQDIAVKRTRIDWSRMKKFLDDAVEFTEILKVKEYGEIVTQVRLHIGKTVEGLSREEQEAQSQGEKKLLRIAEERRKLDEREAEVRREKEKSTKERQKSAESEVKKVLDEGKKTLERAAFFLSLETKEG